MMRLPMEIVLCRVKVLFNLCLMEIIYQKKQLGIARRDMSWFFGTLMHNEMRKLLQVSCVSERNYVMSLFRIVGGWMCYCEAWLVQRLVCFSHFYVFTNWQHTCSNMKILFLEFATWIRLVFSLSFGSEFIGKSKEGDFVATTILAGF